MTRKVSYEIASFYQTVAKARGQETLDFFVSVYGVCLRADSDTAGNGEGSKSAGWEGSHPRLTARNSGAEAKCFHEYCVEDRESIQLFGIRQSILKSQR